MRKFIVLLLAALFVFGCSKKVTLDDVNQISKETFYREFASAPVQNQIRMIARDEAGSASAVLETQTTAKLATLKAELMAFAEGASTQIQELKEAIFFTRGSFVLNATARASLNQKANILRTHPRITILAMGRASNIGGGSYNLKLAKARAEMVRNYLLSQMVPGNQVVATYKGTTDSGAALFEDQVVTFQIAIVPLGEGYPIPPEGYGLSPLPTSSESTKQKVTLPKAPSAPKG